MLEIPETNGPASIIMLCNDYLAHNEGKVDQEVVDLLYDVLHLAEVDCQFHKEIRAVVCPKWHDVRQAFEQKQVDELRWDHPSPKLVPFPGVAS